MFTGIVQATGSIGQVRIGEGADNSLCLDIIPGALDMSDVSIGDSIAVNGVCLTVASLNGPSFSVNVSLETLQCTSGLDEVGHSVNLEKALRLSDRLGGHLVSGHIDATGEVVKFEPICENGDNCLLVIRSPEHLLKYIYRKGSVTVNGVSLTINQVTGDEFSVNLIPHTLATTTLRDLKPGIRVNLEVDMLARYVEGLMNLSRNQER